MWGMVNTKEHSSMTIIGNTHLSYLKSGKNKISSFRNSNYFERLVRCKTASPPPVPDCRGRHFKRKQAVSRLHRQPHSFLVKTMLHIGKLGQNLLAGVYYIVTNVKCLVSNWMGIKKHKFKMLWKFLYEWTSINFIQIIRITYPTCCTALICERSDSVMSQKGWRIRAAICRWQWRG